MYITHDELCEILYDLEDQVAAVPWWRPWERTGLETRADQILALVLVVERRMRQECADADWDYKDEDDVDNCHNN